MKIEQKSIKNKYAFLKFMGHFYCLMIINFSWIPHTHAFNTVIVQENSDTSPDKPSPTVITNSQVSTPAANPVSDTVVEAQLGIDHSDPIPEDSIKADSISPSLVHPKMLSPLPLYCVDSPQTIDELVKKKTITLSPFIPFLQELSVKVEFLSLLKNAWNIIKNIKQYDTKRSYAYQVNFSILFRDNLQTSLDLGYTSLYPTMLKSNRSAYRAAGWYGSLGLDYSVPYGPRDRFYTGVRYGRAVFKNYLLLSKNASKDLSANWLETILGAESKMLNKLNIYGGCCLRLAYLINFSQFSPAKNYKIPGYGMCTNNFNLTLNFYVLYKFSFLERIIKVT